MGFQIIRLCLLVIILAAGGANVGWARDFRVAIDVGHSQSDPGAISARGVPEYRFNRNMARLLLTRLQQDPRFKGSFIVNETGDRMSLSGRPALAESRGADLFLSIHHDSVYPEQLSQWVYEGRLLDVCDQFAGHSIFYSEKNGAPRESRRIADLLGAQLRQAGFTPTLHHANRGNKVLVDPSRGIYTFNNLVVLKYATIPAVLFECGIIKSSLEEVKLCDPGYQQRLVNALYTALVKYAESAR